MGTKTRVFSGTPFYFFSHHPRGQIAFTTCLVIPLIRRYLSKEWTGLGWDHELVLPLIILHKAED